MSVQNGSGRIQRVVQSIGISNRTRIFWILGHFATTHINNEMIIPIYHDKFMEFFNEKDDESYLDFNYKRRPKND